VSGSSAGNSGVRRVGWFTGALAATAAAVMSSTALGSDRRRLQAAGGGAPDQRLLLQQKLSVHLPCAPCCTFVAVCLKGKIWRQACCCSFTRRCLGPCQAKLAEFVMSGSDPRFMLCCPGIVAARCANSPQHKLCITASRADRPQELPVVHLHCWQHMQSLLCAACAQLCSSCCCCQALQLLLL
jgi:hypothetical protein